MRAGQTILASSRPERRAIGAGLGTVALASALAGAAVVVPLAATPALAVPGPAMAAGPLILPLSGTPAAIATDSTRQLTYVAQSSTGQLAVVDDTTGFVLAEITVGSDPDGVAVDSSTDTVYVANGGSGNVSVVDGVTRSVTATVTVGSAPAGIAVDATNDTIFVANSGDGTVTAIDGASDTPSSPVGAGTTPTGVAVDAGTGQVFVTNAGSGNVSIFSATSPYGATLSPVGVGTGPSGIAVDATTDTAYVANAGSDSVSVLNGATGTVTATVGVGSTPGGVAFDPATGDVAVANSGDGTVSVLNGAGPSVTDTLAAGSSPMALSLDSTTDSLFVAGGGADQVEALSLSTTTVSTVKFAGGANGIAVDSSNGDVFALEKGTSSVVLLSGPGLATQQKIDDGGTAQAAVAVDPATNLAYVANYGTNNVSVLDESGSVVGTPIGVGTHPGAVAVDRATDTIYVADESSAELSIIDGSDPTATPGHVATGGTPVGVAVDPKTGDVFVASHLAVGVFGGSPLAKIGSVTLSTSPTSIAFDANDGMIDVVDPSGAGLTEIDPSTLVATPVSLSAVSSPTEVATSDVTGAAYVASSTVAGLWGVSEETGTLASDAAIGKVAALAVDTADGTVYTAEPTGAGATILTMIGGPVAPAPVAGLVATPGNGEVTLSWSSPSVLAAGGSPLTGFAAAMYPAVGPAALAETTVSASATSTTFSGLTNGTSLYFEVAAVNGQGPGVASTSAVVVPATAPGAPRAVSATAGNTTASVSWTAPLADGGDPIEDYVVTPVVGSVPQTALAVTVSGSPPATSTPVTGLTNGTEYGFEVAAVTLAGQGPESSLSNEIVPATVPGKPTEVTASAGNAAATVSWTDPSDDGGLALSALTVTPYTGGSPVTSLAVSVKGTTTSTVVHGLANGTAYTFVVVAANRLGNGPASDASNSVVPATVPVAPTGVTAVAGNASASVAWTGPTDDGGLPITSYVVTPRVGTTLLGGLAVTVTGDPPATQTPVTGLTNGTSYDFVVAAGNARGRGTNSLPSAKITPATDPAAPGSVRATPGTARAAVSWSAPNDGGLPISRYTVVPFTDGVAQTGLAVTVTAKTGPVPTSTAVAGLVDGRSYTFEVTATNAIGPGLASVMSSAVTPAAAPSPPGGVAARANSAGPGTATVQWSASASTGGLPLVRYVVTPVLGGVPDTTHSMSVAAGHAKSFTFHGLTDGGAYSFEVVASNGRLTSAAGWSNPVVPRGGLWTVTPGGHVTGIGVRSFGSVSNLAHGDHVVAIASLASAPGYDIATAEGSVHCFGDVHCYGSLSHPASPVVALMLSPDGKGYLLVEANGSVHQFGDATSEGSLAPGSSLAPIVGATMTSDGKGYLLLSSIGRVYAFGRAHSDGSLTAADGSSPARGIAFAPGGTGYYITQANGSVRRFGTVGYFGSFASLGYQLDPAALVIFPADDGYIEVARDGVLFSFGPGSSAYTLPSSTSTTPTAGIALAG